MMKHYYKAFNFIIETEIEIPILMTYEGDAAPDITIEFGDLSSYDTEEVADKPVLLKEKNCFVYRVKEVGLLRVLDGSHVTVDPIENVPVQLMNLYLLGSCMGIIFQQRGILALHGSCVYNGEKAVLISGESGAGKSTLAAEFLKNGWQLVTDDLAVVDEIDGEFYVRSSYPSQKLWQDSIDYYDRSDNEVTSLYQKSRKDKYNVRTDRNFFEGRVPLSGIIMLSCTEGEYTFSEVTGADKIPYVTDNIYQKRWVEDAEGNRNAIMKAVRIADRTLIFRAERNNERSSSQQIYRLAAQAVK